jgi:hypothetical protein
MYAKLELMSGARGRLQWESTGRLNLQTQLAGRRPFWGAKSRRRRFFFLALLDFWAPHTQERSSAHPSLFPFPPLFRARRRRALKKNRYSICIKIFFKKIVYSFKPSLQILSSTLGGDSMSARPLAPSISVAFTTATQLDPLSHCRPPATHHCQHRLCRRHPPRPSTAASRRQAPARFRSTTATLLSLLLPLLLLLLLQVVKVQQLLFLLQKLR